MSIPETCPRSKEFLWDEQRKKWAQQLWSVSMWAGTWCCNGTTQLCHWKKQACLPSDNCSQHYFAELFPSEMWVYCLKNICLTSNQYVIHSATALPCHNSERRAKKKSKVERYCSKFHYSVPRTAIYFWEILIYWHPLALCTGKTNFMRCMMTLQSGTEEKTSVCCCRVMPSAWEDQQLCCHCII